MYHYQLYGLLLRCDTPLAHLPPAPSGPCDLAIELAGTPIDPVPTGPPSLERPHLHLWRDGAAAELRFLLGDERLCFRAGPAQLRVSWSAGLSQGDVFPFLLGPGLGIALALRGTLCLHAAATVVDGRVLLLMGASGAGKSTTTAALLGAGHALICDDVAALDEDGDQVLVRPSYPALRLAAANLPLVERRAAAVHPLWTNPAYDEHRYYVDLNNTLAFHPQPAPLGGLYLLGPRQPGAGELTIRPMAAREALPALMEQLYTLGALLPAERQRAFRCCARLAERLPVRAVAAPDDLARLPALADALADDFRTSDVQHH